ncbi:MAG: glycosyltransferase family 4 protein [Opitutaceae bacterium]
MRAARSTLPGPPPAARFSHHAGLFFDEFDPASAWIRDTAELRLPPGDQSQTLILRGEYRPHPAIRKFEGAAPGLLCRIYGQRVGELSQLAPGPFELRIAVPATPDIRMPQIVLSLTGVGFTNFLAWLGRRSGAASLQHYRQQYKNRQLRITSLSDVEGEVIFDFSVRLAPYSAAYARKHVRLGLNIAGFLTADLGVGESARCMVRAADAAGIPAALVPLKLHCKNRLGDQTYAARLQADNPHPVNVVHLDPPATHDLDHHHGRNFRAGKYNIAYWAWELPEFPDAWIPNFGYFDEVWCPSEFVRSAISHKSPLPVITMPHAISVPPPAANGRARFGLPDGKFLILCLYDLNSYSERKNPRGMLEAFRQSGLAGHQAALVVKVQNAAGNETDFAELMAATRELPGIVLLTETLSRAEICQLEAACDCFLSLHRSEGFGLAIAECMALGKPVISTDWSAPAEFVTAQNGCPVNYTLTTLAQSRGPYSKGQVWAEPDATHAAWWMKKLCADRALGTALGTAAAATIASQFAPAVIGARYRRRLESIACF